MSWPLSQDYNEAIQDPLTSFDDAELKAGEVITNALGIPLPRSGNFADVYEVRGPAGARWAVKCFTREIHGLRERYAEISKYLRQANLPFMVDFQYLEQGIRVRGQWFPILKMQWVEGFVLNEFVRDNLDKKPILQALGQIWLRMGRRLREAKLAHGDLQHGNVMFVPGGSANSLAVKLIDYDGMCVPSLAGKNSGEVGHPAYQHPERLSSGAYNPEVDRFSLLSIAAALRCLMVGGRSLWERYDNGDNLLFRQADLQAPKESPLFRELQSLSDPRAQQLVNELYRACQGRLDAVPLVTDLLPEEKEKPAGKITKVVARPAAVQGTDWDFGDEEAGASIVRKKRRASAGMPLWAWGALGGAAALLLSVGVAVGLFPRQAPADKEETSIVQKSSKIKISKKAEKPPADSEQSEPPEEQQPPAPDSNKKGDQTSPARTVRLPGTAVAGNPPLPAVGTVVVKTPPPVVKQPPPVVKPPPVVVKPPPPPRPRRFSNKPAVPDEQTLDDKRKLLRVTYRDDYKSKPKRTLAASMLEDSKRQGDLALAYVMLNEASDLAAQDGDLLTALRAASELGSRFAVDPLEAKCRALEQTLPVLPAKSKDKFRMLTQRALLVLDRALIDEDFAYGDRLLEVAKAAAAKGDGSPTGSLTKVVNQETKEFRGIREEYDKVKRHADKLEANPDDPDANLALGRFRCFLRGNWNAGLPLLARGNDKALSELAEKDIADPGDPIARAALGDAWSERADKTTSKEQEACRRRAFFWYQDCREELEKKEQARVSARVNKLATQVPDLKKPFSDLDMGMALISRKTGVPLVRVQPQQHIATRQLYRGPIDVHVTALLTKNSIRITFLNGGELILRQENQATKASFFSPNSNDPDGQGTGPLPFNVTLKPGVLNEIRIQVTANGWSLYINGKLVRGQSGSRPFSFGSAPMRVWADDGEVDVLSLVVKRVR